MILVSGPGVVRQAGHTDAERNVKGDVAVTVCLSATPRQLMVWIIRHHGKYVGYYEALDRGGIKVVHPYKMALLDNPKTYELAEKDGWTITAMTIDVPQGHLLLWDGHMWHAGGELVGDDVRNFAWWGRRKKSTGGVVYTEACNERPRGRRHRDTEAAQESKRRRQSVS
jgi:hypothetical protein